MVIARGAAAWQPSRYRPTIPVVEKEIMDYKYNSFETRSEKITAAGKNQKSQFRPCFADRTTAKPATAAATMTRPNTASVYTWPLSSSCSPYRLLRVLSLYWSSDFLACVYLLACFLSCAILVRAYLLYTIYWLLTDHESQVPAF